jgi:glycerol uptake facilitator-like aquaporin
MEKVLYEFLGTLAILSAAEYYHNLAITVMVIVIAKFLTGGHLNPAFTFLYYLAGNITWKVAIVYVLAQLSSAVVVVNLAK